MNDKTEIKVKGALCSNTAHNKFVSIRFHRTDKEVFLRFRNEAGRLLHGYLQFDGAADIARIVIEGMDWQDASVMPEEEKEFYDHSHDENGERYYRRQYHVVDIYGNGRYFPENELYQAIRAYAELSDADGWAKLYMYTFRTKESFENRAIDDTTLVLSDPR